MKTVRVASIACALVGLAQLPAQTAHSFYDSIDVLANAGQGGVQRSPVPADATLHLATLRQGAGDSWHFEQPSPDSTLTLIVDDTEAASIAGRLETNGALHIVSPAGLNVNATANIVAARVRLSTARLEGMVLPVGYHPGGEIPHGALLQAGHITAGVIELSAALVESGGVLDASGDHGGRVTISGDYIAVPDSARIDASGRQGGGQILIGGDYRGSLINGQRGARRTFIAPGARMLADAHEAGAGGKIVVWSDELTRFLGQLTARGGGTGGNGGMVEVSGKRSLLFEGSVDTRAPVGQVGSLLLDPDDIVINHAGTNTADTVTATAVTNTTATPSQISDTQLNALLGANSVTVQTTTGSISDQASVNVSLNANTLTLQSGAGITLSGTYAGGNLALNFKTTLDLTANPSVPGAGATTATGIGATSQLTGPNSGATFTISGVNSGGVGVVSFTNVGKLVGGSGADSFVGSVAGSLQGSLNDGGGATTLNGNITSTGSQTYSGAITLAADTTLTTTNGGITLGSVNSATRNLTLSPGSGSVSGAAVTANDLNINGSGSAAFSGAVAVTTIDLTGKTGGSATFNGDVTATSLTTAGQPYNVSLTGTSTTITNVLNFLNTGSVTLGDGAGDVLLFTGGLVTKGSATNPSSVNVNGTLRTAGQSLAIGAVTVGGDSTFDSTNNGGTAAGATVDLGAITATTNNVTLVAGAAGNVTLGGVVSAGNLAVTSADTVTLDGSANATFASISSKSLALGVNNLNVGTGSANLTQSTAVTTSLGSIVAGTLRLGGAASVGTVGTPILTSATALVLSKSAGDTSISNSGGVTLAGTTGIGALRVYASGAITQGGSALIVGGTITLDVGANPITLNNPANQFGTFAARANGTNDISLAADATIILGAVDAGQNLTVNTTGNITDSGGLTVIGSLDLTAGGDVTLDSATNTFAGTISLSVPATANVTLVDTTAVDLPALSVNSLGVVAGGAITQGGTLMVTNLANFKTLNDAGAAITLADNSNAFGSVGAQVRTANDGADATAAVNVHETGNTAIFGLRTAGALTLVTNGGALTQNFSVVVGAATSITTGAASIALTNTGNNFTGAVSISNSGANNVAVTDTNALKLGNVTVGTGTLTINANVGGTTDVSGISQLTGTTITSAGAASFIGGAGNITLSNANNNFSGTVAVSNAGANPVSIRDEVGGIVLATSSVGSDLTITSNGGAVTEVASNTLTVPGILRLVVGASDATLTQNNTLNRVVVQSANNTSITSVSGLFNSSIDGAFGLTLTLGSGGAKLLNVVGGTTPLSGLTVNGTGTLFVGTTITAGASGQTFNVPVRLVANSTLNDTAAITFNNTVDGDGNGPWALTVNAAGTGTFAAAVGGTNALAALTTDAAGASASFKGGTTSLKNVTTTGAQTYNDNVTLNDMYATTNSVFGVGGTNSASLIPMVANGLVAAGGTINLELNFAPAPGTTLTVVNNTGLAFIQGQFTNLAHGQLVTLPYNGQNYAFVANYYGGTGNDLVLQWADTRLLGWGQNNFGQLNNGSTEIVLSPGAVPATGALAGKRVLSVAIGGGAVLAVCSDGTVVGWGENGNGQLGNNAVAQTSAPVAMMFTGALAGKTAVAAAVGIGRSLVLFADGTVAACGRNSEAQIGNGSTTEVHVPVAISIPGNRKAVAIRSGAYHSLALCDDGTLFAWGYNAYNQMGDGTNSDQVSPTQVTLSGELAGQSIIGIEAGFNQSFVQCANGAYGGWGYDQGLLGHGDVAFTRTTGVLVKTSGILSGETVVALKSAYAATLVLTASGKVATFGDNSDGVLGDGTNTARSEPVWVNTTGVLPAGAAVAAAMNSRQATALTGNNTLVAWGAGDFGQLGRNSQSNSNVPISVDTSALQSGEKWISVTSASAADFNLAFVSSSQMAITSATTATTPVGTAFAGYTITATGSPTSFDASGLPTGLTLNASTGAISGTPTASGTSTVILSAFGANGGTTGVLLLTVGTAQTITFGALAGKTVGDAPFALTATASSGLVVSYISSNPAVATVSGSTVTIVGAGTTTITAQQVGNSSYAAAADVAQTLAVSSASSVVNANFTSAAVIPVTANGYTATGQTVNLGLGFAPTSGTVLTVVKNTAASFIQGNFTNLAQGQTVTLTYNGVPYSYVANYYGGTGNDLVLQPATTQIVAWGDNFGGETNVPSGLSGVVAIAASNSHSVALKGDGTVVAWGDNYYGQTNVPSGLSGVVAIAAANFRTVALKSDGTVVSWGYNYYGQTNVPSGLSGVVAVAAGYAHTVALRSNGTVAAWGDNSFGQTNVPSGLSGVVAIAAGNLHSVALTSDGAVVAWGSNAYGQTNVPSGLSGVVAIAAGAYHTVALKGDGTVMAWGYNGDGETNVPSGLSGVVAIAAQWSNTVALKSDGTVAAWGDNSGGQTNVPSGLSGVVAIAAGALHTVALVDATPPMITSPATTTGTVGASFSGYTVTASNARTSFNAAGLPAGLTIDATTGAIAGTPTEGGTFSVVLTASNAFGMSAPFTLTFTVNRAAQTITFGSLTGKIGGDAPFALTATASSGLAVSYISSNTAVATVSGGTVTIVGLGTTTITAQQAGNSSYTSAADVVQTLTVSTPPNVAANFTAASVIPVTANGYFAAGRTVNLSLGFAPTPGTVLTVVKNTAASFIQGNFTNLAHGQTVTLTYNGVPYNYVANYYGGTGNDLVLQPATTQIVAWGANFLGQTNVPSGLSGVVAIAAGTVHTVALKSDGTVMAWGDNSDGQTNVPSGLSGVVAIAAGNSHSVALKSDGTVVAWGKNAYGQTNVPSGLSGVVAIAAGGSHTVALKGDGTVMAWGYNGDGETNVPSGLSGVVAIAAGNSHTVALKSDGTVVAWGANFVGQSNPPSGLSGVVGIAAGSNHTVALKSDGTVVAWGDNSVGQTNVPSGLSGVIAIVSCYEHTVALKSDGSVVAWGNNTYGQTNVPSGLSGVIAIAAGYYHSVALVESRPPVITSPATATGAFGAAFSGYTVTASDTPTGFSATGLPAGLAMDATTGAITGTPTTAGTFSVVLTASNADGTSAPFTLTFTVNKGVQTITFGALAGKTVGDAPFSLTATSSSGLAVSYTSSNPGVATVSGSTVTVVGAGTTTMTAQQAGDLNYTAAGNVAQTLTVSSGAGEVDANFTSANVIPVTANGYNATGKTVTLSLGFGPAPGTVLTVVNNDGIGFIQGRFANLAHGQAVALTFGGATYNYIANYYGGTGNDLVLMPAKTLIAVWGDNSSGQAQVPSDLSGVIAIAAGSAHAAALKGDGTVTVWGDPYHGQQNAPVGLTGVVQIAAGGNQMIALKGDGTVVGWGGTSFGPVTIPGGLSGVVAVSAGTDHWVALKGDGTVTAGGRDSFGQTNVPNGLSGVVAIAAGGNHTLALKSDGSVVAWGSNTSGETSLPSGLSGVIAIASGMEHSLALKADGTVVAWGNTLSPPSGLSNVVAIAAGNGHSTALMKDGTVVSWGVNNQGQTTPPTGLSRVFAIGAGDSFQLALVEAVVPTMTSATIANGVFGAFFNSYIATATNSPTSFSAAGLPYGIDLYPDGEMVGAAYQSGTFPVTITATNAAGTSAPLTLILTISPGVLVANFDSVDYPARANADIDATGNSIALGLNFAPLPGTVLTAFQSFNGVQGRFTNLAQGEVVSMAYAGTTYQYIANYYGHNSTTLDLIPANNRVIAWGQNNSGQTAVPPTLSGVMGVAAGSQHAAALKRDGTVTAWGDNSNGQTNVPQGLAGVTQIAAGGSHTLALKTDGTVVGWGGNTQGEVTIPTGLAGVVAISAGVNHSVALKRDLSVVAWGSNAYGQTTVPAGLTGVVAVSAGGQHTLAALYDYTVVAWGSNEFGQASVPADLYGVTAVAAGTRHSLALLYDGTVTGWGDNTFGQTNVPSGLSGVVAISAGDDYSTALKADGTVVSWGRATEGQTPPSGLGVIFALSAGDAFQLALMESASPVITSPATATGTVGASFSGYMVTASDSPTNFGASGLPAGLALNATTGAITGTPSAAGTFSVTLTATGANGTSAPFTLTFTVNQAAQTITFGAVAGKTVGDAPFALSAIASSGLSVSYTSSNTAVATVSGSTVTIVGAGTTTITAQQAGNSNYAAAADVSQTLTVSASAVVANFTSASMIPVTAAGYVATGRTVNLSLGFAPAAGTILTVVKNTAASFIQGNFTNLAQGQAVTMTYNGVSYDFVANYYGGTGNELVLLPANTRVLGWGDNSFGETNVPSGLSGVVALAAGDVHSVALKSDGTVVAWGHGSETNVPSGLSGVVAIAVRHTASMALKSDGTVVDWGPISLQPSGGLSGLVAIALGREHMVALKSDGSVVANGSNAYGNLNIPSGLSGVVAVVAGDTHSAALKGDGTVVAWGNNSNGQTNVPSGLFGVVAIAAGGNHTVALKSDGTVVAWGYNADGETNVPSGLSGVVAIAAANFRTVALKSDGTVVAWGDNGYDQTNVPSGLSGVVGMAAGLNHTLVLALPEVRTITSAATATGVVGQNFSSYTETATNAPTGFGATGLPPGVVINAATGAFTGTPTTAGTFSVGLWATSAAGTSAPFTLTFTVSQASQSITFDALATKTAADAPFTLSATASSGLAVSYRSSNTAVATVSGATVTIVGAGSTTITAQQAGNSNFTAASDVAQTLTVSAPPNVDANFTSATVIPVTANGYGATGRTVNLSLGFAPSPGTVLVVVKNTATSFIQGNFTNIAQGQTVTLTYNGVPYSFVANYYGGTGNDLVLQPADTRIFAWGFNASGQTTVPSGLSGVVGVAAGDAHTVALRSDGTVVAWGDNSNGRTNVPSGLSGVVAIAAGDLHTVALKSDGSVVAWGANFNGQTNVPGGLSGVIAIAGGNYFTVALKSDGTVVAWGDNSNGQTNVPSGLSGVVAIAAGGAHTVALKGDGTVAAWGNNAYGQTNVPSGLSGVVSIAAARYHTVALKSDGTVVAWGQNDLGQTNVPSGLSGVVAIAAGGYFTVALKSDGTLVAWSEISGAQTIVPSGLSGVIAIAAGTAHAVALVDATLPTITSPVTATGTVGASFSGYTVTANAPLTSFSASGLPTGVTLNGSTGAITGTPNIAGVYSVALTAANAAGTSAPITLTFTVNQAAQAITFGALAAKTASDAPFTLSATASSGLAVSFTSSNTAVATVSGSTVTIVGVGTTTITAQQTGDSNYTAAVDVAQTLSVGKISQTITFGTLAVKSLGDAAFTLNATASSGLAVSYTSSNTAVATVSGSTVTIVGVGTTTITAQQAGDSNYSAAADMTQAFSVGKLSQTITFGALAAKALGDAAFTLNATASSGLAVSYTSSNTAVATVSGSTVTIVGAGTTTITAKQAGNSNYTAAADVAQTLSVGKLSQTITFGALAVKSLGDAAFALSATASSGLAVSYTSSNTAVVTVSGSTVTIVGAGTTTITAQQAGDSNYTAAADVAQTLSVGKTSQTISFGALAAKSLGDSAFTLSATASSGLAVSYTSSNTAVATVSGSTVTIVGVGSTTITAQQAGNSNYTAAADVAQTLSVGKIAQTITFGALEAKTAADAPFTLSATASSGLVVNYTSSNTAVATVSGSTVTIVGAGTTTISAQQAGDSNYAAAPNVAQTLTVSAPPNVDAHFTSAIGIPVTANGYSATGGTVNLSLGFAPVPGTVLMVVKNTATAFIQGYFGNLAQGQAVTLTYNGVSYNYLANYYGGTGNDLVLEPANTGVVAWGANYDGQINVPSGLSGVVAIAAGGAHTVALKSDGTVTAWGNNTYGQRNVPSGLSGAVAIAAGGFHSVALKGDGTVVAWGANYANITNVPSGLSGVVAVAAGAGHTVALKSDGTVVAWGYNGDGETNVPNGLSGVVAIAAGGLHSVALKSDGTVAAWGNNPHGETNVPNGLSGVVAIAAGGYHSVALKSDGTVVVWGDNSSGQKNVPSGLSGVVAIAAGDSYSVALKSDGTVVAWGYNGDGETNVPSGLSGVAAIAAGYYHTAALTESSPPVITSSATATGTVGAVFSGYTVAASNAPTSFSATGLPAGLTLDPTTGLITGTPTDAGTFSSVLSARNLGATSAPFTLTFNVSKGTQAITFAPLPGQEVVDLPFALTAATTSGLAVSYTSSNPGVATVNGNTVTIVGVGTTTLTAHQAGDANYFPATDVSRTLTIGAFTPSVSANYTSASVIPVTANGYVATGRTVNLSLGVAPASGTVLTVVKNTAASFIQGNFTNLVQGQAVTLTYNGVPYNFVANYYGGTGNDLVLQPANTRVLSWGHYINGQTNVVPSGLSGVVAIAARDDHTVAVKSDGTVVAWNDNGNDQTSVPSGLSGVVAIAPGSYHTVALKSDGTVVAWDDNGAGQTDVPSGLSGAAAITAGNAHTVALKSDGTVVAWGDNSYGQTNVPSGLFGVVAIAAGWNHTVAVKSDGTVVAWGYNGDGQTNVPNGLSGVVAVAAGGGHTVALKSNGTVVAWGWNAFGQTNVPSDLSGVVAIAAGYAHTEALKSDGTLAGWGDYGETNAPPSGLSGVIAVAAGFNYTVALVESRPPVITSPATAAGAVGSAFSGYTVTASNTPTSFSATGLPTGLTLNESTGAITGTPTAAGTYTVTLSATNGDGTGTGTLTLAIGNVAATVTLGNLAATYDGTARTATATTSPVGLTVTITYNGSATAPTAAGSYTVVGTVSDSGYSGSATGTLVIAKGAATVTLGNLAATYDGTAKAATATTSPAGLTVTYTYNGSATVPTAVGSYTVVGTVSDSNYAGSATGTLAIAKAAATVTLGNLAATYNATAKAATATTSPAGLTVTYTYNGSATVPTAVGSYTVVGTVSDSSYAGSATGTLVIAKGAATVTLGNLAANYNGTAKAATATTSPAGLTVTFTYNGSATAPTAVGSYTVVGTVSDSNYAGSATGTLVIAQASQSITFSGPGDRVYPSSPVTLSATASSGLTVTFTLVSGPATLSGSTLTFTGTGSITVRASQAGTANYLAAPDVIVSFNSLDPFAVFVGSYGLNVSGTGHQLANPSGDGLPNLLKFLLGGDPTLAQPNLLPTSTASVVNGVPSLVYQFNVNASAASQTTMVVEYSTDLVSWTAAVSGQNGVTITTTAVNGSTNQVTATIPTNNAPMFARLRVTQ